MSTEAERKAVSALIKRDSIIVELGAHKGEDSAWMSKLKPLVQVCVEPDPDNFKEMYKVLFDVPSRAIWGAITAEDNGHVDFFACDNATGQDRASGSIRRPTGHLKHFEWCKFERVVKVPAFTLDTIAKDLPRIDLLWVDIQGAERDMIAGGREALAKTHHIFIEAEEVEMYEGQALRPELLAMLPDFEVMETFDYNLLLRRRA